VGAPHLVASLTPDAYGISMHYPLSVRMPESYAASTKRDEEALVNPTEYVFYIDVFTPNTLPLGRMGEYLVELAKLLGHREHAHFVRVDEGSAKLVHKIDEVDAPKVKTRLDNISVGDGPKEAQSALKALDEMLANDNATGHLMEVETGRVIIPFQGRLRPKPVTFPPFREDTTIDGQLVSIGGRDPSAHAILQDGDTYHTGLIMKREVARELGPLLYGPQLRLHGNGRFERLANGVWKMTEFRVDHFEQLDSGPLAETLRAIRAIPNNGLNDPEAYHEVVQQRGQEEDEQ
jgi:hypothetical protein